MPIDDYLFLRDHDRSGLLQTFAALSVMPENHGKNFRLDQLIQLSLLNGNNRGNVPGDGELKAFLERNFTEEPMEDVVTNHFTDLITFFGGDYIIFPGITENGQEILDSLLHGIFHWPVARIPDWVKNNFSHVVSLGLAISDHIARKLGYSRYMEGDDSANLLHVPSGDRLFELKAAVTITRDEMKLLMNEHSISPEVLKFLLLDPAGVDSGTLHQEESEVLFHPIIEDGNGYTVLSPTSICLALSSLIWKLSGEWNVYEQVSTAYHDNIWNSLKLQLGQMGFDHLDVQGSNPRNISRQGLYVLDKDKIAFVHYIGANEKREFTAGRSRDVEVVEFLAAHPLYKDFKVMVLHILAPTGDVLMLPLQKIEGAQTIAISAFDLEILWKLKNTTALDLWKFTLSRDRLLEKLPELRFFAPLLDQYKLYKDNADSFYLSDNEPIVAPVIIPGYSQEWVVKAKHKKDKHSGWYSEGDRKYLVPVERKDSYAPVYLNTMDILSGELRFLVEGYGQPVWVTAVNMPDQLTPHLKNMYFQLTDAIAYWLWQVNPSLKGELSPIGAEPIIVEFELSSIERFSEIERDYTRQENLEGYFAVARTETGFLISIPPELIAYLYGADNQGERVLLAQLLAGFNLPLTGAGRPKMSGEAIAEMIDRYAPLGMKKKLFVLDTTNNLLLDPTNLRPHRYVQEYDVSIVLDCIVPALGEGCPSVGEVATQAERNALAKKISGEALMNLLIEKLAKLDSIVLLKELISMNESLIRKREELRIHTPTRIACFVSVEEQTEDLQEALGKLNRTTIAVRCLIEQITAQPCSGTEPVSTTAIDEIVAIMDQIISWGSISDQIHFDLFDIKMAILPSGRIGTEKSEFKQVFDPYYMSKANENVKDAISTFEQVFPQLEAHTGAPLPEKLNRAFLTDFGVSFERICEFIEGLAKIGFTQPEAYASLPLVDLRTEVNRYVTPFEEEEFTSVVTYLSLEDRGTLLNIDKTAGHDFIDIMPWRFNRMLSLMRKPLVITGKPGDADRTAYWGPRQVLASRIYLAEQCQSDRLRLPKTAKAVKSALGDFADIRGSQLVKDIVKAIDPMGLIIDTEQFIGPKYELKHIEDIGDVDVLIIDPAEKMVYSLESKSISPSRNIKEMIEEVSKLVDDWIPKHMRRDEWIRNNLDQLGKKYGIDLTGYTVKSIFITQEDMLTPHLKKMSLPLPFLSSYDLSERGFKAVQDAGK